MTARPALLTQPFILVAVANLFICIAGFLLVHLPGLFLPRIRLRRPRPARGRARAARTRAHVSRRVARV
ncbi:MAG: hypothetical protein OXT09_16255, partial [Myxococcales bacterium]|nr:hypothetical protein [Myxococcales bacterium]